MFSLPIWIAARVVGASNPTLVRSALALVVGTVLALVSVATAGFAALLLVPLSFLLSFKFLLGASLGQAFVLSILAFIGAALMVKVVGGGIIGTTPGTMV